MGVKFGEIKDSKVVERAIKVLSKFKLPTKLAGEVNMKEVVEMMSKDKKNESCGEVALTLVSEIGKRKEKPSYFPISKIKDLYN